MSNRDREKWDAKYREAPRLPGDPPAWLARHRGDLPRGRALDLATGLGAAAQMLARHGCQVTAIDISPVGVSQAAAAARAAALEIDWIVADLDTYPLPRSSFDVITVFYYLDRLHLPARIEAALNPGGMLVFETYSLDQLDQPQNHIQNRQHLLAPGELLRMFPGLRVRHYRDVVLPDRAVASLVAQKVVGD